MGDNGEDVKSTLAGRLRIDYAKGHLIVTDLNNVAKLLAGIDSDGQVRVKLAQDNIDVQTATSDQLIWSSDFRSYYVAKEMFLTIPAYDIVAGSSGWFTAVESVREEHFLGFTPKAQGSIETGPGTDFFIALPWTPIIKNGALNFAITTFTVYADDTYVYASSITIANFSGAATLSDFNANYTDEQRIKAELLAIPANF